MAKFAIRKFLGGAPKTSCNEAVIAEGEAKYFPVPKSSSLSRGILSAEAAFDASRYVARIINVETVGGVGVPTFGRGRRNVGGKHGASRGDEAWQAAAASVAKWHWRGNVWRGGFAHRRLAARENVAGEAWHLRNLMVTRRAAALVALAIRPMMACMVWRAMWHVGIMIRAAGHERMGP